MKGVCLSICLVTYEARDYLRNCLHSIYENPPDCEFGIIVVDNCSTDGTQELLKSKYPEVDLIENQENMGFTAPSNQALRKSKGDYLLLLNPDTHLKPQAFNQLIGYMQAHPDVGICGPKVLNTDGTLQKPCRRGESRPWAVFTYFLGLSTLFPKRRLFGEYLIELYG